jgi:hypothetical protein
MDEFAAQEICKMNFAPAGKWQDAIWKKYASRKGGWKIRWHISWKDENESTHYPN